MDRNKGWVKLWREQFSHEISEKKPWCDGYAWSYLYARANYKAGIVNFRNQYIPVERGQLVTSKLKLQQVFGWSKRRTNSFLSSLESREMCAIKVTKRFIIITISNYEKFQSTEEKNEPIDVSINVPTDGQQVTTNKNIIRKKRSNIGRSKKQTDPRIKDFLDFWRETFFAETGQPYMISYGKEGRLVKTLLQTYSLEILQEMARAFFRDEQCIRRGLTLGIFYQEINRLIGMKAMNPLEAAKRELRG